MDYKKLSFFAALCFFLSAVETAIPKPVPFFRLGLANLPVMLSLVYMEKKETSFLIILKVLLQGIVSGTLFSYIFLFSLAGSSASGFGMMGLYALFERISSKKTEKPRLISWIGLSLFGGLLNNIAQLVLAYFVMFGRSVKYIAPWMLLISFVTSLLLGIFACNFEEKSQWLKQLEAEKNNLQKEENDFAPRGGAPAKRPTAEQAETERSEVKTGRGGCALAKCGSPVKAPVLILILSLAGIIGISFCRNIWVVYTLLFASAILARVRRGKIRVLPGLSIIFSITILSLFSPYGKILFEWNGFKITLGALESGLLKSGRLCAMVFMSQVAVDKNLLLPGKIGFFMKSVFGTVAELTAEKIRPEDGKKSASLILLLDQKLLQVWEGSGK